MINAVHLQGFKNFRDVELRLGPLTVIVGTNASGKSNLRDAFRFLHGIARGYSLADIVGSKYVDGVEQWKGIRGGTREIATFGQSSFYLAAQLSPLSSTRMVPIYDYEYRISVELGPGNRPLRVARESLYYIGELVYDSHPATPSDRPIQQGPEHLSVRLGQDGQQGQRGDVKSCRSDQPVLSQFPSNDGVPQELRTHARDAMRRMQSMRFLELSPDAMKVPSIPGQPLGDRGENLSSVLQVICEDKARKEAMTEWIRQLTPLDVADLEFVPDQTGKILVALVERNGRKTSAYSASDGTLRFLAMMAALMAPDAARFYFLEEIDNGIHPTRLNLLLQLIEQHARRGKVQVVTTTHSPQLLAMLSPEAREDALLVYRFEDENEAHVQRILDLPTAKEVLQRQNLARLHESGWLENVVAFAREEAGGA